MPHETFKPEALPLNHAHPKSLLDVHVLLPQPACANASLSLQGPGGRPCPTRKSSLTMKSRRGWVGSTSSATLTTNTNRGPNGPASWRDGGWEWASTRPWWRAVDRNRGRLTHTGRKRCTQLGVNVCPRQTTMTLHCINKSLFCTSTLL